MRVVKDRLRAVAAPAATVFMSTHTLAIAEEIADRIGIMDQRPAALSGNRGRVAATNWPRATTSLEPLFLELTDGNDGRGKTAEGGGARRQGGRQQADGSQEASPLPPSRMNHGGGSMTSPAPRLPPSVLRRPPCGVAADFISPADESRRFSGCAGASSPPCCGKRLSHPGSACRWWSC